MPNKINNEPPEPPEGLRERGQQLWRSTLAEFELAEHELSILLEACRTVDLLDMLQADIDEYGPTSPWGAGIRANPAAVEARQQRVTLARLLAALRVPADEHQEQQQQKPDRFQQRGGARGPYAMAPRKLTKERELY